MQKVMRFVTRLLAAGILTGFLAGLPVRAQTTTQITLNFNVDYVLELPANQYMGSGTIAPFGNATLNGVESFTSTSATISITFTLANGDTFQATSGGATASGSQCTISPTITGGTGAFVNATGSIVLNYACSSSTSTVGSFQIGGTGSITVPGSGTLSVTPPALTFSFFQGSPASSQTILLNNGTARPATFSATTGGESWLTISPTSGAAPAFAITSVTVNVDPSRLAPGTYVGTVTVAVTGGPQFPVSITVTVNSTSQALALSETALRFQVAAGAGAPPSQSITVLNRGTGSLNWTAKASTLVGSWLSVSPLSGTSGASATVAVDPANLQPGDYYGLVVFSSPGAADSPQTAVVVLNVLPATTVVPTAEPTGLIFVGPQGGANPAPKLVTVANSSNQSVTVTATVVSQQNGLFSTNLSNATVTSAQPAQFMVSPNLSGLKAGVYRGVLRLGFGNGSIQEVTILVVVTPPASTTAPQDSIRNAAMPAACTPTQLLPVSTVLGPGFNATAAWPTALEVQVVDDCGSAMGRGSVVASFSSGDAALSLVSLGAGNWSSTWQPRFSASSGAVVITVMAESAQPPLTGTLQINGTLQPNQATPGIGGVVSTASFRPNAPLAPGAFASVFGSHLATATSLAGALPLTTKLAGAQAILGGELMPVQYASDGQLNVIIPYDLPPNSTQQLIVLQNLAYSTPEMVTIASAQPAVFSQNQSGKGPGAITVVKPNGTQFSADPSHPASAGDALVIYCAGLGAVNPPVATGAAAPGSPLAKVSNPITVTIGGQPATVLFAGLTPAFAGLYQVNVVVPKGITPAPDVPVVLTGAGLSSPAVTVAIR
jgi:uncharacterized protein (TIGR03437 family)